LLHFTWSDEGRQTYVKCSSIISKKSSFSLSVNEAKYSAAMFNIFL